MIQPPPPGKVDSTLYKPESIGLPLNMSRVVFIWPIISTPSLNHL